jgi:hypothetical protein
MLMPTNTSAWYTDSDINTLLQSYLDDKTDVEAVMPLLGTDWHCNDDAGRLQTGNELKDWLQKFVFKTARTVIPVNLDNNHWVLLYRVKAADAAPVFYYVDPLGNRIHPDVEQAIRASCSHDSRADIINLDSRLQARGDAINCGAWIVEAARSLVKTWALPDTDIVAAREEHQQIVATINTTQKSVQQLTTLGLFKPARRDALLDTLSDTYTRNYVNHYLSTARGCLVRAKSHDERLAIQAQNEELIAAMKEMKP